jgi:hypothetical protein
MLGIRFLKFHAQLNQLTYNLNAAIEISLGTRRQSFINHFSVVVEITDASYKQLRQQLRQL